LITIAVFANYYQQASAQKRTNTLKFINIKEIRIEGNTVFSDSEIKQRVDHSRGQNITLEQLFEIKNQIEQLYLDEGYVSSGAFLPAQKIENEILVIEVVEGSLAAIEIEGLSKLSQKYIESRLPKLEEPLNANDLNKHLARLKQDPLIDEVSGELRLIAPGKNLLFLEVEENKPIQTQLSLRNTFSPTIGNLGGTANIAHQNLLGFGDRASFGYTITEGLDRYGVEYSIPFNITDGRVALSYDNANSKLIEEIISVFDIQADFEGFGLVIDQPVVIDERQKLAFSIELEKLRSETFVAEDVSFPFVDGLEDGVSRITPLRLGANYTRRGDRNLIVVGSTFNVGLDIFDVTDNNNTGIDGLFWSWQGNMQLIKAFDNDGDWQIRTNIETQLTPDRLLPLEQLTVGGDGSVRGYRRNLIVGDNAVVAVAEGQIPLVKSRRWGNLYLVPFVDFGTVWSNSPDNSQIDTQTDTLISTGIQISHQIGDLLDTKVFYAVPLSSTVDFGDASVEQRWGFSMSVIPFRF